MCDYGLLDIVLALFTVQIVRSCLVALFSINSGRKLWRYAAWGMYIVFQYLVMISRAEPALMIFFTNILLVTLIQIASGGGNFKTVLFRSVVFCASWMAAEVITLNILLLIGTDGEHFFTVKNLISKITIYLAVQVYGRWRLRENTASLSLRCLVELFFIPGASVYMIYCAYALAFRSGMYVVFTAVSILLLLVNCEFFMVYDKISEQVLMERQNKTFEQALRLYIRQTTKREEAYRRTRILRHDLNNRLVAVSALLSADKPEEAADEIRKMIGENSSLRQDISHSGNLALDAMVNYKYSAALAEGIMLKCCVEVPAEIPAGSTDLCVILGNLLDNALEAVRLFPEEERQVELTVRLSKGALFIAVENPYRGEIAVDGQGRIRSSKTGDHGIGLLSVERTVAKYDGNLSIRHEDGIFRVSVILYSAAVAKAGCL